MKKICQNRIVFVYVFCARVQESRRLAAAAGPVVVLYSRHLRKEYKDSRKQSQGTEDLFGDDGGFQSKE